VLSKTGKRIGDISYDEFKLGPSDSRLFQAIAHGTVAQVALYLPKSRTSLSLPIVATKAPRGEAPVDVGAPRYVRSADAAEAQFERLDAKRLRAESGVKGGRSSAVFGFNAPRFYVTLPKLANSAYADIKVDKVKPTLTKKAKWELETNGFSAEGFRYGYTLRGSGDAPLAAREIAGVAQLVYPLGARVVEVDVAAPNRDGVDAEFTKNQVRVAVSAGEIPSFSNFSSGAYEPVRAFDKTGRELRQLSYRSSDGESTIYAFWGTPAKLRVVLVEDYTELQLPFKVKVPALLPKSKSGEGGDH
jgi:hypothetical protein